MNANNKFIKLEDSDRLLAKAVNLLAAIEDRPPQETILEYCHEIFDLLVIFTAVNEVQFRSIAIDSENSS